MNLIQVCRQFAALLKQEWRQLVTVNPSDRGWQMPLAAAIATGIPLLVGAYFGQIGFGLVSSMGGLAFLYMPSTPLSHRMVWLMACAFGMTACYALGVLSHVFPPLLIPVLTAIAILVTMVCKFYGMGPPGSLFFIMAAAIGAYTPVTVMTVPLMVGLLCLGTVQACVVGFIYSLMVLRQSAPKPIAPLPPPTFDGVVFDSVVIGGFVGLALALAQLLHMEKAYWVPVSCLAVIQGASLRAVWTKQLQRLVGTAVGLMVSWGLLAMPLNAWGIAACLMVLSFVIETLIVRNYAFAAVFITPLTILLAEAATHGHANTTALIEARFLDTVLGCLVGLAGGACLHSQAFRQRMGTVLRQLLPSKLVP